MGAGVRVGGWGEDGGVDVGDGSADVGDGAARGWGVEVPALDLLLSSFHVTRRPGRPPLDLLIRKELTRRVNGEHEYYEERGVVLRLNRFGPEISQLEQTIFHGLGAH